MKYVREGEILYDILYMKDLKRNDTNEFIYKTDIGLQTSRMNLKWITNKDVLYSSGNSAQCYVAAWMGEESGEKGYMCVYDRVPLLST